MRKHAFVMGGAVLLTACAATTAPATSSLVQTGPETYALTEAVTQRPTPEEMRTLSLKQRAEKYTRPLEARLENEARATCAGKNATYEYVTTRIWHPAGKPHYTLNFRCLENASQKGAGHE